MKHGRRHSLLYALYLRSPLWRLRRRIWIVRARGRCQQCGSRRQLTIHHRTYQRLGRERRHDVTVLCWDCHCNHHVERRRGLRGASVIARIGAPARERRRLVSHTGQRTGRLHALLALIALPTVLIAATLVVQR